MAINPTPVELVTLPNVAARWTKTREVIGPESGIGTPYEVISALGAVRDIWYVDGNTSRGNDNNDGRDPTRPLATIGAAVAKVSDGDTVLVSPLTSGSYSENVDTPTSSGAKYVTLMGLSPTGNQVNWGASSESDALLDIAALGWRISGFTFTAPTSSYSVFLRRASGVDGAFTQIDNCTFFGGLAGGAIDFQGAPFQVHIVDCEFGFHTPGTAIVCTDSGIALAYRIRIERCHFHENAGHIDMALFGNRGFNSSVIKGCTFNANAAGGIASAVRIDLTGGRNNLVVGNYLDDAADAAAYVGGTNDMWNNWTDDAAEQPEPGVP